MRKTKIICTLGPSVDDEDSLKRLVEGGMDVARFNLSHGDHSQHRQRAQMLKKVRMETGKHVPMLLDTKGPEIRLGKFENNEVYLREGNTFKLTTKNILGDEKQSFISHKSLYRNVGKGSRILINDGLVELEVECIKNREIICIVKNGGIISNNKGVNIPETDTHLPSLTEQDALDMKFAVEQGFDFIAQSFVRKAEDVLRARNILKEAGGEDIKIIAKIENREGVNNFDEILAVSDGIMVARGDLGVEIPMEEVPVVQKMIIEKCYKSGKPVITATQMLESMISNPRPTRAEASDVANAVYDGTSAVMLSGETAAGKYPVESVKTMARIAVKAEESIDYRKKLSAIDISAVDSITNSLSYATCAVAAQLRSRLIITATKTGKTAKMISRFRPECPIIAITTSERVYRQLHLSWGVIPFIVGRIENVEQMIETGIEKAKSTGMVKENDIVLITAGGHEGVLGNSNMLKIHKM